MEEHQRQREAELERIRIEKQEEERRNREAQEELDRHVGSAVRELKEESEKLRRMARQVSSKPFSN